VARLGADLQGLAAEKHTFKRWNSSPPILHAEFINFNNTAMVSIDPLPDITIGYPKLAARIEIQPELSIYRRFGALNAQNLLYFQAQLVDLEAKLRAQQAIDNTSTHGHKSKYAVTWLRLENSAIDGDTKQRDLVIEIRALLREFSEFVDRGTYMCAKLLSLIIYFQTMP
jgi:hypothetical protein